MKTMIPDLSDLVITPTFRIFRVVDISIDHESGLCVDRGGAILEIPTEFVICVKNIVSKVEYEKLQRWFLLSSISLN